VPGRAGAAERVERFWVSAEFGEPREETGANASLTSKAPIWSSVRPLDACALPMRRRTQVDQRRAGLAQVDLLADHAGAGDGTVAAADPAVRHRDPAAAIGPPGDIRRLGSWSFVCHRGQGDPAVLAAAQRHGRILSALRGGKRASHADAASPTAAVDWFRALREIETRLVELESKAGFDRQASRRSEPIMGWP